MAVEMNDRTLQDLRKKWADASSEFPTQKDNAFMDLVAIRATLKNMELAMNEDATYELLAPGLTREDFDNAYTEKAVIWVLSHYHWAEVKSDEDRGMNYDGRRSGALEHQIEDRLPRLEEAVKRSGGIPATVPVFIRRQAELLLESYRDGTMAHEVKRSAAKAAVWDFRRALYLLERVKQNGLSDFPAIRDGLSHAESALRHIDRASEYYKPQEVARPDVPGSDTDGKSKTVMFSYVDVLNLRKALFVAELAHKFHLAKEYQEQGHFFLDDSGGHKPPVRPMQHIALKLRDFGYDLQDPETYTAIGTDKETFLMCYQRETAAWVDSNTPLLKKGPAS